MTFLRGYFKQEETLSEQQRMVEGRRMFQIFAAKMFEQRVLTAYREKVSILYSFIFLRPSSYSLVNV